MVAALRAQGSLGLHVEGLALGGLPIAGWAHLHAQTATGAVFPGHLDGEALPLPVAVAGGGRAEALGGAGEGRRLHHRGADHGVGAHHHALAALHAQVWLPHRDRLGDVALLPLGRAAGKAAVAGEGAHRQGIGPALQLGQHQLSHHGGCRGQVGRAGEWLRGHGPLIGSSRGGRDLPQAAQGCLHRRQIAGHDRLPLVAIAVLDGAADRAEGRRHRHHRGHGEEAHLHHRVDGVPQAVLLGDGRGIQGEHPQALGLDLGLHPRGDVGPAGLGRPGAVEQQRGPWGGQLQQVELLQEIPVVAGHQLGLADQVGGADRLGAEAQV